jgi:hypothetical protein
MSISMRPLGAVAAACLAALGPAGAPAQAPMAGTQAAFSTAVAGGALAQVPPWAFGYNPYPNPIANYGTIRPSSYGGDGASYGDSSAGYGASPGTTGYGAYPGPTGSGYRSSGYGGGSGSSYDTGGYTGYLTGAAAVTTATASYQKVIQEARLLQHQANRSSFAMRRKIHEEALSERAEWFKRNDPNVVYQQDKARDLDRARHDPPLTEILSGQALNALLAHLEKQQGKGLSGVSVPLQQDVLRGINVSGQATRANPGLLKSDGRLQWPVSLAAPQFADGHERLGTLLADAVNDARSSRPVPAGRLKEIRAELSRLNHVLVATAGDLSPSQYVEARRYLHQVEDAVKALEDPRVANYVNGSSVPRCKTVVELVQYMSDRGLVFAPAVAGDADAYRALYSALRAFDAGVDQAASGNGRYP